MSCLPTLPKPSATRALSSRTAAATSNHYRKPEVEAHFLPIFAAVRLRTRQQQRQQQQQQQQRQQQRRQRQQRQQRQQQQISGEEHAIPTSDHRTAARACGVRSALRRDRHLGGGGGAALSQRREELRLCARRAREAARDRGRGRLTFASNERM